MSKIVCDICGTTYQDTAGSCPVCGWNQSGSLDVDSEDLDLDFVDEALEAPAAAVAEEAAGKEIFDFDAVNDEPEEASQPEDEDDEDEEEESGSNTVLVVILVLLILALIGVSLFIAATKFHLFDFLKGDQGDAANKPQEPSITEVIDPTTGTDPMETVIVTEPAPQETQAADTIPCVGLTVSASLTEFAEAGQKQIFAVTPDPANTTDQITYSSGDESVVTVSADGTVTAVGEGQTTLYAKCGEKSIETRVVVKYPQAATEPATEAPANPVVETVAPTTPAPTEAPTSLKFKKYTDGFSLALGYQLTLEFEGDIPASEVRWTSMDGSVAFCHDGVVTAAGRGTTTLVAEYNGMRAQLKITVK